jgi:hypothetical protein
MSKNENEQNCEACRFWRTLPDDDEETFGQCRRSAPSPVYRKLEDIGAEPSYGQWPLTYYEDWCGEFEPKPAVR